MSGKREKYTAEFREQAAWAGTATTDAPSSTASLLARVEYGRRGA
jgi:hypothetical protein